MRFLAGISSEVTRCGGHALPSAVIKRLCAALSDGMFGAYEALLAEHTQRSAGHDGGAPEVEARISQRGALQLLFDVRFLNDILGGRQDLEKRIDECRH